MTKLFQPNTLEARINGIENRLQQLETESPRAYTIKDGAGQIRVIVGQLDILGGVYVGKYGWVVLDASGTLVASQYA